MYLIQPGSRNPHSGCVRANEPSTPQAFELRLHSCCLQDFWCRQLQLCSEDFVPKPACHPKTILEVCKVMLKVIFFKFSPVCGKPATVSEAGAMSQAKLTSCGVESNASYRSRYSQIFLRSKPRWPHTNCRRTQYGQGARMALQGPRTEQAASLGGTCPWASSDGYREGGNAR